jgi:TolB-like protein
LTRDLARDLASAREHLPELLATKRTRDLTRGGDRPSIAVLPFVDLSASPKQEVLADAMTDQLITALTAAGGLQVVSRASSMACEGQSKPVPQLVEELGVEWLLLGTITGVGATVRITAQLVDADSDENRWANAYSRRPRNVLSMHAGVAATITRAVRAILVPRRLEAVK